MFTYDIITDVNNNKFAIIRIDTFNCVSETHHHVENIIKNVPDNITINYNYDVVEYLFN